MRHVLLSLAILCNGCGLDPGGGGGFITPSPDMGQSAIGYIKTTAGTRNGNRLLVRYVTFQDGAQVPFGFYDTKYNMPCAVGQGSSPNTLICYGDGIPSAAAVPGVFAIAP